RSQLVSQLTLSSRKTELSHGLPQSGSHQISDSRVRVAYPSDVGLYGQRIIESGTTGGTDDDSCLMGDQTAANVVGVTTEQSRLSPSCKHVRDQRAVQ